jgi:glutamate synthase domain-containing protein 2
MSTNTANPLHYLHLRYWPWWGAGVLALVGHLVHPLLSIVGLVLFYLGVKDITQTAQAVRRNYPVTGRLRYALESIRPEIRQYFIESDAEKLPFSRKQRALVYARSKVQNDKSGFGTIEDLYTNETQWLAHSMSPIHVDPKALRIDVGGKDCRQPYSISVFNISAMSFGSLSANAIQALNKGAVQGGFAHDTGEGSMSVHHRKHGGDLIWEIGSGYFGCRDSEGRFDPQRFAEQAKDPQVKMIEIKVSQGAKPGHGGVLPAAKVNAEIAEARGVPIGQDCVSPAYHSAFSTPLELMSFIAQLRELSGGKPVGFKLCIGQVHEWFGVVKAMQKTGIVPDFIVVDGSEGGTGAAPVEFADHMGMPLRDGLRLVHMTMVGAGLRDQVKIGASGKVTSAFDIARCMALGADWCNSARGFMFALGCIQSRSCHTDHCPTGVATQDPLRQKALVVTDKAARVANFHGNTLKNLAEMMGAAGLTHPRQITSDLIMTRDKSGGAVPLRSTILNLPIGTLHADANAAGTQSLPEPFKTHWPLASAERFGPLPRSV